jgi:SAM-dependent methyltransferase
MARRRIEVQIPVLDRPSRFERGAADYRGYVGADANYDLLSGIQFNVLFALGMLETHKVLDLGCGSLRVGRLLIPYLEAGNYYGIEPNKWLVDEGIERNVGRELAELRKPTFRYVADFSVADFGVPFDFIVANSIFSHTFRDLARESLPKVAAGLADKGLFALTFVEDDPYDPKHHAKPKADDGSGWLYPETLSYEWPDFRQVMRDAGFAVVRFDWFHPQQTWVVAGHLRHADWVAAVAERAAHWQVAKSRRDVMVAYAKRRATVARRRVKNLVRRVVR